MQSDERRRDGQKLIIAALIGMFMLQSILFFDGEDDTVTAAPEDIFELTTRSLGFQVQAVDFMSSGIVVAAGYQETILKYTPSTNEMTYINEPSGSNIYYDLDISDSDEALLVGSNGKIMAVGSNFLKVFKDDPTSGQNLNAVSWRNDGAYAIIGGDGGTLLRYYPESSGPEQLGEAQITNYDTVVSGVGQISALDWKPDDSFALMTMSGGDIFKLTADSVTDITGDLSHEWKDIAWAPTGEKAILVGSESVAYLYDAVMEEFTPLTLPTSSNLDCVAWKDSTTAYLVGYNKFFLYTDGYLNLTDVSPEGSSVPGILSMAFTSDGSVGVAMGAGIMRWPNGPPSKVTVNIQTVTETSVTVSYSESEDADFGKYEYYISLTKGFTPAPTLKMDESITISQNTYTFTPLDKASKYYIIVTVCDMGDLCANSDELEVSTLDVENPPAITLTVNDKDYTSVDLQWSLYAADDFSKYEIYKSTTAGFTPMPVLLVDSVSYKYSTSYTVSSLTPGTTYYFKVRVYNTYEYHSDSSEVSITTNTRDPPAAVTLSITANEEDKRSATLFWGTFEGAGFSKYEIHYSTQSGFTPDSGTLFETDTYQGSGSKSLQVYMYGVTDATTFYFIVRVVDSYGLYSDSNVVSATLDGPPPGVYEFKVVSCEAYSCKVSWQRPQPDAPSDFKQYEIYKVVAGKETKVGTVKKWDTTSYTITGLDQSTSYYFRIYVVDDGGMKSTYAQSTTASTQEDEFAAFLEVLNDPTCICVGGFFLMVILISVMASMGQKYGGKAVLPALPVVACIAAFVVINGLNTLFELGLPTWFFLPLFILCVILTVVGFAGGAVAKSVKRARWRREEARREAERRQQEFENKKAGTAEEIRRLSNKLQELRPDAPMSLFTDAKEKIGLAKNAFGLVNTIDDCSHLDASANNAAEANRVIVEIEAYIVAKSGAMKLLENLKVRTNDLKVKKAPRIDKAMDYYKDAKNKLDEATSLVGVKAVVDIVLKGESACDESAVSLRSAEDQLKELKKDFSWVETRTSELKTQTQGREGEDIGRLISLLGKVRDLLTQMGTTPDVDAMFTGREHIKNAKDVITRIEDRERKRASITTDLEKLDKQINDTAIWSSLDLTATKKKAEKAKNALLRDQLPAARSSMDEAFDMLADIKSKSSPNLLIVDEPYTFQVNKWEDFVVHLKNKGSAQAKDITINIRSPSARLQDTRKAVLATYSIKPGDETKVPIPIQFDAEGAVPTSIEISYKDHFGDSYSASKEMRVEVVHKIRGDREAPGLSVEKDLEEMGLIIRKKTRFSQGFFVLKISIQNRTGFVVRDVNFKLDYDHKIFRLHHVFPTEYKLEVDSVTLGDIENDNTTSCEFFLQAFMCTETALGGVVTFKDLEGQIHAKSIKRSRQTFICPTFEHGVDIAPGQLRDLVQEEGWKRETSTFAVPSSLDLPYTFDIMKEAIERFDPNLNHVFDDSGSDPMYLEAWYYGETKKESPGALAIKHSVIGRVQRVGSAGTLQLTGASPHQGQLFALSTRLSNVISESIKEKANLAKPIQQIFQTVNIQDSVIQGSTISMGGEGEGVPGATAPAAGGKTSIKGSTLVRSDIAGGGDTEIEDSVLQRTSVGGPSATPPPAPVAPAPAPVLSKERELAYHTYKHALREVYDDGIVEMHEREHLKKLRDVYNISYDEHERLEEQVLFEMKDHLEALKKK